MKRTNCGSLRLEQVGETVKLQGWVARRRDLGGLIFLWIRDRSGLIQVVVHPGDQAAAAAVLETVRLEWVVEVTGEVVARSSDQINSDLDTGEVEVVVSGAEVLSPAEALPFAIDDQVVDAGEDVRLKYRYLELRRPALQEHMILRHKVTLEARKYFDEKGFLEIETPILTRSTPEGARDYLVPSRVTQGSFYALPQSPQIFKQILMVAGLERYVQIARCFRDEDLRADRQPEFTQIDLEMSFVDEEDVMALTEGLFHRIFPVAGIEPPEVFPCITYAEAMRRYGSDRPDLRYDLEIGDVSDLVTECAFRVFTSTVKDGGVVRGIAVPEAAGLSRRQIDDLAEVAKRYGAAGVLWIKYDSDEPRFQVGSGMSGEEVSAVSERLGLEPGGLGLLVAGSERVAATSLGALREHVAKERGLIPEGQNAFVWVTDFPLVEWDGDAERWHSVHHPFTAPCVDSLDRLEKDPGAVTSRAYDVVLNGMELGGGSIRIHRRDLQERIFHLLDVSPEEAEARFGWLLEALAYGAPPHGGLALGLDRLIMVMAGASSIREVIAFPKTASASCLLSEAPATVDEEQIKELGLSLRT